MITSSRQGTETTTNSRPSFGWNIYLAPGNTSETSPRTKTETMTNQTKPITELFGYAVQYTFCPLPLVLLST
jgi:hypothetical protein